jgi:hypothetical protein
MPVESIIAVTGVSEVDVQKMLIVNPVDSWE